MRGCSARGGGASARGHRSRSTSNDGKPLGDGEDDDEPPEHVCDVYISDQLKVPPPDRCIAEADAIARTRNNLAAMADQLEAARAEVERLRAHVASLSDRRGLPSDG